MKIWEFWVGPIGRSVIFGAVCLFGATPLGAQSDFQKVLLLNSYDQRMTWVRNLTEAVEEELKPQENRLHLHVENLDTKEFHHPEYFDRLEDLFRTKYVGERFDLILASDNNAYDFLRARRDRIFGPVPVVFSGVNNFAPSQLEGLSDFTGVAEVFSAKETVETALNLHPEVREVFVINDYLKTGRAWERDIRAQLEPLKGRVTLRFNDNLPIGALQAEIAALGPESLVLLGVFYKDSEGVSFTFEKIGAMLSGASSRPVYALLNFNLGHGVVGGKVIGGYYQGEAMAKLARRVLAGERAGDIPVQQKGASNQFVFDYTELERFGLPLSKLPPDSLVINRPFSLFETYKKEILATALFVVLLLVSVVVLLVNIRRRALAEEQLAEKERKFRGIFNETVQFIGLLDPQGRVLDINRAALEAVGSELEPLLGKFFWDTPWWTHSSELQQAMRQGVAQARAGQFVRFEATHRRPDGALLDLDFSLNPVFDASGKVVLLIPEGRDITALKKVERDLSEHKANLEETIASRTAALREANEAKNKFLSIIAHDLRGPVGNLNVIFDQLIEPGQPIDPSLLSQIRGSTRQVHQLLEELLAWARGQSGQLERNPERLDVNLLLEDARVFYSEMARSKGVNLILEPTPRLFAHADRSMTLTVLRNLVANAIKFTDQGQEVRLGAQLAEGMILFSVSDNGVGMSEFQAKRLFKLGEQVPSSPGTHNEKGTGLGLILCKEFVETNFGKIWVESELGRGSRFFFTLPSGDAESIEPQTLEEQARQMSQMRTLLVDDNDLNLKTSSLALRQLGVTFDAVTNGLEAFQKASAGNYDLILMDIDMPVMDGVEATRRLREALPQPPLIIALTSYLQQELVQRAGDVVFDGLLHKPLDGARLTRIVAQTMGKG